MAELLQEMKELQIQDIRERFSQPYVSGTTLAAHSESGLKDSPEARARLT